MLDMLKGKKTYLVALGVAGVTFAHTMGWIDNSTYTMLLGMLNSAGLMTLSAKVNRTNDKIDGL